MRLKGFTLAEVLISLGIIGVVAALTLPGLNVRTRTSEYEAAFDKVVRDLSNVNQIIMSDRAMDNLRAACGIAHGTNVAATINSRYLTCITEAYGIRPGVNPAVTYTNMPAGESGAVTANNASYYVSRNGDLGIRPRNIAEVKDYPFMQFYIDVNGPRKGPNRLANDLHIIMVGNDGSVYGYGSVMTSLFGADGAKYAQRSQVTCTAASITTAAACSGSITDNGGKIVYSLP